MQHPQQVPAVTLTEGRHGAKYLNKGEHAGTFLCGMNLHYAPTHSPLHPTTVLVPPMKPRSRSRGGYIASSSCPPSEALEPALLHGSSGRCKVKKQFLASRSSQQFQSLVRSTTGYARYIFCRYTEPQAEKIRKVCTKPAGCWGQCCYLAGRCTTCLDRTQSNK